MIESIELASVLLLDRINALGVHIDAIGGLTSGADPLIVATSLMALKSGQTCPASSCATNRSTTEQND